MLFGLAIVFIGHNLTYAATDKDIASTVRKVAKHFADFPSFPRLNKPDDHYPTLSTSSAPMLAALIGAISPLDRIATAAKYVPAVPLPAVATRSK